MLYDLVIENGRVIDPESNRDEVLSMGITDGRIQSMTLEKLAGRQVIDAAGCVISPGFIDIHTHEDYAVVPSANEEENKSLPKLTADVMLRAGVTTMLGGNCGIGVYPFEPYYQKISTSTLPIHYLALIGHSALREWLGIGRYHKPSLQERELLREMVREGLKMGFPGVSFGLQYAPGTTKEEMMDAAEIIREYDGFLAVHMRYDYPSMAEAAVAEMMEILEETGVRMQLSHLAANIYGKDHMKRTLDIMQKMNERGFDVRADMYPYDTWATGIQSAVFDGDPFRIYEFTYEDIEILTGPWEGTRCTPELFSLLREAGEDTTVACHGATPWADIVQALRHPLVFMGSDAIISRDNALGAIKGHPRSSGSTARFLRRFAIEENLLDLKTALAKLTIDPANRLKLASKGRLQEDKDADIVIFKPEELMEKGGYGMDICALPPEGIRYVIVNGKLAYTWEDGLQFTQEIMKNQKTFE